MQGIENLACEYAGKNRSVMCGKYHTFRAREFARKVSELQTAEGSSFIRVHNEICLQVPCVHALFTNI